MEAVGGCAEAASEGPGLLAPFCGRPPANARALCRPAAASSHSAAPDAPPVVIARSASPRETRSQSRAEAGSRVQRRAAQPTYLLLFWLKPASRALDNASARPADGIRQSRRASPAPAPVPPRLRASSKPTIMQATVAAPSEVQQAIRRAQIREPSPRLHSVHAQELGPLHVSCTCRPPPAHQPMARRPPSSAAQRPPARTTGAWWTSAQCALAELERSCGEASSCRKPSGAADPRRTYSRQWRVMQSWGGRAAAFLLALRTSGKRKGDQGPADSRAAGLDAWLVRPYICPLLNRRVTT